MSLARGGGPLRTLVAGSLLALFTGAAGLPGLGQQEARVGIDVGVLPWAAVVRLQIPGSSRCTGFLVGPQTVVTAAHCLYSRRLGRFVPAGSVHVLVGYADGAFAGHAVASSFRVAEGYDPLVSGRAQGSDLAVAILATPLALRTGALVLDGKHVTAGTPLMMGGYGQDRAERILADRACKALGYARVADGRIMLAHDCAGTRGTSGGPVMAQAPDGEWRIVGVQVAANSNGAGGLAVPAAAIQALIGE